MADLKLEAEAVALLALVVGQDVEPGDRPGSWRIARRVAPDRVICTVDPQARHTRKTSAQRRDGRLPERTLSVPACLRGARFAAVGCSTETHHLQGDSARCSLLRPVRLDF